jgi:hypothetical protein
METTKLTTAATESTSTTSAPATKAPAKKNYHRPVPTVVVNGIERPMTKGERKAQKERIALAAHAALSNPKKLQKELESMNGLTPGDRRAYENYGLYGLVLQILDLGKAEGNNFIIDVCTKVNTYMRISEKQAYYVSKFADEKGMKAED